MITFGRSVLIIILVLSCSHLWFLGICEGHPLCLDFAPPFKAEGGLDFCSDYTDLGCCTRNDDLRISTHYHLAARNVTNATCAAYLKTVLCLECSPLAVHLYDAETTYVKKPFPGLCRSYCGDIYRSCSSIVSYVTNSSVILDALRSGEPSFCSAVRLTDMKYCYPDVLNDPEFNPNVTRTYSTTEGCLCVKKFAQNLRNPLLLLSPDDGSGRIFVGEQLGLVTIYYKNGTRKNDFFLDITDLVLESASPGDERGFLGMAFHPDFRLNQKMYVYFSIERNGNLRNRVSEFTTSSGDRDKIDKASERVLLEINKPFSNHNGGQMLFGTDGYLYITTGDGGAGGDPYNNAQNLSSLLGKVLRIDVNGRGNGTAYAIPPTNPFILTPTGARPEVFAYGCRNMWRCSVDPGNPDTGYGRGRIFCGDVGQAKWEEVDIIKSGGNYGWNTREGFECYNSMCGRIGPEELPIYAYDHSVGNSIIGGYVYRGCDNPNLQGLYFYADYGSGKLFRLKEASSAQWENKEVLTCGKNVCFNDLTPDFERNILSFGEDFEGEVYILTTSYPSTQSYTGSIYKIVDPRRRGDPSECRRNSLNSATTSTKTPITTIATTTTTTPTTTITTTTSTTPATITTTTSTTPSTITTTTSTTPTTTRSTTATTTPTTITTTTSTTSSTTRSTTATTTPTTITTTTSTTPATTRSTTATTTPTTITTTTSTTPATTRSTTATTTPTTITTTTSTTPSTTRSTTATTTSSTTTTAFTTSTAATITTISKPTPTANTTTIATTTATTTANRPTTTPTTTTITMPTTTRTTIATSQTAINTKMATSSLLSRKRSTPLKVLSSTLFASSSSSSSSASSSSSTGVITTTTTTFNAPPTNLSTTTPVNFGSETTTFRQLSTNWNWSCDFEVANRIADWCGIVQAKDDSFDWTIFDKPTPSDPTGPDLPYSGRWYIYIEASSPCMPNDTAKIYIPSPTFPGLYCLSFHYHMFGFHIRELQVFRETNGNNKPETVWRKTKEQGNVWLFAQLTINIGRDQRIGFIGVRGDEYSGDIGLDALSLVSNACA